MHPSMRPEWAKRHSELLANSPLANLICLEFPIGKGVNTGGPPFGVTSVAYLEHLSRPGQDIPYDAEGNVKFNPNPDLGPGALERVDYFHPADTHQVGKDDQGNVMDYISIWRHR